jgi:copper chaperone CopZ
MSSRLNPYSPGVVHSSPYRTRLKVPRQQVAGDNAHRIKGALETVPGVKDVRVSHNGSVVVEHDDRPDIIENIGEAIAEAAPTLLEILTDDSRDRGGWLRYIYKLLDEKEEDSASQPITGAKVKRAIPLAFFAAGAYMILEGESILAGVGPLALFYWAFDSNWKFKQEKVIEQIQEEESQELGILKKRSI